jgi:two-component system, NtrC family, sensor kinase
MSNCWRFSAPAGKTVDSKGWKEHMTPQAQNDTIMVVDDTPANLRLLEKMLREHGYRVRCFPKGAMALKSALDDPPDLIFLDINMPEMNGYEVCEQLKSVERTRVVPVIFISALTETLDKVKAFGAGGVDYITKPFQFEEVHARAEAHLKLVRAHKAIEEKNAELKRALDDLKMTQQHLVQSEKLAALGVLTAGIAHEINNPVNFIKTSAIGLNADMQDLMKLMTLYDHGLSDCMNTTMPGGIDALKNEIEYGMLIQEIPDLLNNIQEGVRRTEEIVNSLRTYSRMDHLSPEMTDVHKLINASLVVLKPRYKQIITIEKKYGPLPELSVQPGRLIQVLTNIISNAIDAIQSKGSLEKETITIKTFIQMEATGTYGVIEIGDTGSGVPEALRDKIFDPFFTTKDVGKGTGLGLSICLGIIQDHKGRIEIKSITGVGTMVSILLPLVKEVP